MAIPQHTKSNAKAKQQKRKKEARPVLLGLPDGPIDPADDHDAFVTKIGGKPLWLDASKSPDSNMCRCGVCGQWMYLIFQGYVPLADSPHHRVLYVWACNQRMCMRKEGSFSVVRSHKIDPDYLAAQRRKKQEQEKQRQKQAAAAAAAKAASPFGAPQGFQLGDLWGASPAFGAPAQAPAAPLFGTVTAKKAPDTNHLAKAMSNLSLTAAVKDPVNAQMLPTFPGEYLYITEENLDRYDALEMDLGRYKDYIDMEEKILSMQDTETEESWAGETYEKQQLPRGFDKQFKKFMERVQCEPSQCVRYDFGGSPLLFSLLRPQQTLGGKCSHCGGPRVFEFQLMPNILSILPTTEYADSTPSSSVAATTTRALPGGWNVGMEFGTLMVFVCQRDCHPGPEEDVCFVQEQVLVQYEQD